MVEERNIPEQERANQNAAERKLIIMNDDHNSFKHVIDSLIEICDHEPCQAEQCALIAHHKGSCHVNSGPRKVIEDMRRKLSDKGILAIID